MFISASCLKAEGGSIFGLPACKKGKGGCKGFFLGRRGAWLEF